MGRLFLSFSLFLTFLWEYINIYLPIAGPKANNSAKCTTGNISSPPPACLRSGTWSMRGRTPRGLEAPPGLLQPGFCGWFVNKASMWLVRPTSLLACWGSGFYFCFSALPFNLLSSRISFTYFLGRALDSLSTSFLFFYAVVCPPSCTSPSFCVFWSDVSLPPWYRLEMLRLCVHMKSCSFIRA